MKLTRASALLLLALSLTACGDKDEEVAKSEPLDVLYARAQATMNEGGYKTAIDQFQEVERQYPYSEWAKRAQLMAGYAAYRAGKFDDAVGILERYVKLYPTSESTPYAYYLKSLCYYEQITDVGRDQDMTSRAMDALTEVANRFPNTPYARDAKLKKDLTVDHLAGKEMEIGRYYLKRDETLSAINRFKYVIDNYQTTSHTPEALHRLVEAYMTLGVEPEAQKYAAVLGYNYPASNWYADSYALMKGQNLPKPQKKGLLNKMLGRS